MHRFYLGDDVEGAADRALELHVHERLEPCPKAGRSFAHAFAHRADHAPAARQDRDDAVCFTQFLGAQHNADVTISSH